MAAEPNTLTSRRIVIEKAREVNVLRTYPAGSVPLTNPGTFKKGVYRGVVNPDGTATLTEDWRA